MLALALSDLWGTEVALLRLLVAVLVCVIAVFYQKSLNRKGRGSNEQRDSPVAKAGPLRGRGLSINPNDMRSPQAFLPFNRRGRQQSRTPRESQLVKEAQQIKELSQREHLHVALEAVRSLANTLVRAAEAPAGWSDKYSCNVAIVDKHHRFLFSIIKLLEEMSEAPPRPPILSPSVRSGDDKWKSMKQVIDALAAYTVFHFRSEEELFDKFGVKDHKGAHKTFIDELEGHRRRALTGDPNARKKLLRWLQDWLVKHIMGADKTGCESLLQIWKEKGIAGDPTAESPQKLQLRLHEAFCVFDIEKKGRVTHVELQKVLSSLGHPTAAKEAQLLVERISPGHDNVTYDAFVRFMSTTSLLCVMYSMEENIIVKRKIPTAGVVCTNEKRMRDVLSWKGVRAQEVLVDDWGVQIHSVEYKNTTLFVSCVPMGAAGAGFAFLEMFAAGAKYVVRYGTHDHGMTKENLNEVILVDSTDNLFGLMRDSGCPESQWGLPISGSDLLLATLRDKGAKEQLRVRFARCHNIEDYHALCYGATMSEAHDKELNRLITRIEQADEEEVEEKRLDVWDMESAALYLRAKQFDAHAVTIMQCVLMDHIEPGGAVEQKILEVETDIIQCVFDTLLDATQQTPRHA